MEDISAQKYKSDEELMVEEPQGTAENLKGFPAAVIQ